MFGFSLSKLLVIAVVIAAIWYFFKFVGRRNQAVAKRKATPRSPKNKLEVEDLVHCAVCGTYVQPGAASCERSDCPER